MLLKNKSQATDIPMRSEQKGFLLLEVLVALTILSAGIIGVIKAYTISLRAQRHARYQTSAFLLASNLQTEIEIATIEERQGQISIGDRLFEWNIEIEPTYTEDFKMVSAKVKWAEQSKEYKASLSNLYLKSFIDDLFKK